MPHKKFFIKELAKEFRLIETLMKKEDSFEKKIYYLSAAYGITSRTYRFHFSDDVLLADLVLNAAYQSLSDTYNRLKSGETTIRLEEKHFEKIGEGLKLLAEAFENEENILEPLKLILTASFSASGTGNYLMEKGMIKL